MTAQFHPKTDDGASHQQNYGAGQKRSYGPIMLRELMSSNLSRLANLLDSTPLDLVRSAYWLAVFSILAYEADPSKRRILKRFPIRMDSSR
jgi:hypothetical protein